MNEVGAEDRAMGLVKRDPLGDGGLAGGVVEEGGASPARHDAEPEVLREGPLEL